VSAVTYPAVRCDGRPGCSAETNHPMAATVSEVRRYRRDEGWHTRPGGRDICPDCWAAGRR
jgi:hypothetical protein